MDEHPESDISEPKKYAIKKLKMLGQATANENGRKQITERGANS